PYLWKSLQRSPYRHLPKIVAAAALLLVSYCMLRARAADVPKPLQDAYREYSGFIDPARMRATVNTLASFGSRVAGYPGDRKAADYVEQQFRTLGLSNVQVDEFPVTVPYDPGVDNPDQGAFAQLQARSGEASAGASPKLRMYPLWPNLIRTSTLPVDGLTAPRLGAKAVIFVAPTTTMRGEAEAKFISIPISIPRFWMSKADAAPLLAACASGRPPTVKLTCNMPWQTRKARNITGWIQGTDPKLKDQIIVVQAYYDSISVVPALAPGADTACGMAGLLELARTFKAHPPKRSMMFVATSGHFQALQGIREYINAHMDEWTPAGWFEKKHPVKDIYLWCGLDLTSQTRSVGIFYKGWFYDYREDIQGKFSDIARVCRENAEK